MKVGDMKTVKDMVEYLTKLAKDFLKKQKFDKDELSIPATIFVLKDEGIYATCFEKREEFLKAINSVSMLKPKVVGVLIESYVSAYDKTGKFLGRKEVIFIQAYSKTEKLSRTIDKFDLDKYDDSEEFDGPLSIKDYDRVFNFE